MPTNGKEESTSRLLLGLLKDVWAHGGRALFLIGIGIATICGFWIYAIVDLFQRDKVLEAVAAFILVPLGAAYGLGRFFGWW